MEIAKQNMLMTSELVKILKLLEENDIEAIPFKGPALSQLAYGDVVSRQYCDLDILINEEKLTKVYELLEINGFITNIDVNFTFNKLFLKKSSDIQFYNEKNNILVELHWQLFRNEFSRDNFNNLLTKNIKSIEFNNENINMFSDEFNLVYLCTHASKHLWERIEWIIDINKLIKNSKKIDWNLVQDIAYKTNSINMLKLGLFLVVKLFGTKIPENIIYEDSIKYKKLTFIIYDNFLLINHNNSDSINNWNNFKFFYLLQETFVLKLILVYKTIFLVKDRDIEVEKVSGSLFSIYINRFVRLIKKYF